MASSLLGLEQSERVERWHRCYLEQKMTPLFNKLNLKPEIKSLVVLNAPVEFQSELDALSDVEILTQPSRAGQASFLLCFVRTLAQIEDIASQRLSRLEGDPIVWFAYPKGTSKKYRCEFHRDTGWESVGAAGYEGVRQVAIDANWSALRFRKVEYIKTMIRAPERASSAEGKKRTARGSKPTPGTTQKGTA